MSNLVKEKAPVFPISKVKKIAKCDPEYVITSNVAISATAFAAELFVQNLVEESLVLAQLNSKGKTSLRLSLNSIEECVEKRDSFRFLEDAIKQLKKNSALDKKRELNMQPGRSDQEVVIEEPELHEDDGVEEEEEEDEVSEEEEPVHNEELLDDSKDQQNDKSTRSVASLLSRFQYKSALDVGEHSDSSDIEVDHMKSTDP
ncbi:CMF_HP2_G0004660.mRNA.1.CDS.1 [Saccharomyces cerevisiae]|nr:CMF_HP2_G0004660.mRNA.1.CDS.1 [Saccharomyces cerevisiae]CAI6402193.1 CMF_HP2_G0004660.mRNA.1.CDS.1 [Saccharomyces cerevisiae]CAI6402448.1 CMF_HP1_G0004620.mRNA.1.CDS.1 [Saccharomyces cerevisiae]CAI7160254.1 CMF_collapsed_G0004700.mRNA.1.CDS.1 [Saccharomyces cerevisiae]